MSDSFMRLRCKAGDIAFITNDEVGCEANIGRLVRVVGELEYDRFGLPEWRVEPLNEITWLVWTKSGVQRDVRPFNLRIGHPDTWLLPIDVDLSMSIETTDEIVEGELDEVL